MSQVKVKFCGLTQAADVQAAIGATAVGFVFVAKSKRHISPENAEPLFQLAKSLGLKTVALFMDATVDEVNEVLRICEPDVLQFHGQEDRLFCEQFGTPYWKAIPMLQAADWQVYMACHPRAEAFLLDAYGGEKMGGSGETFEWFEFPLPLRDRLILAGGLNAANLPDALTHTKAGFIDLSSGIERSPGVKSVEKMQQILKLLNN